MRFWAGLTSSARPAIGCRTRAAQHVNRHERCTAKIVARPARAGGAVNASSRRSQLTLDADGRVPLARYIESPNCDERPPRTPITLAVIHGISLPPGEFGGPGIVELFTNRLDANAHPYYASIANLRVSAHFVIRRDGELLQFVSCDKRAWHAGESSWHGRERCNDFSIGIELEGADTI